MARGKLLVIILGLSVFITSGNARNAHCTHSKTYGTKKLTGAPGDPDVPLGPDDENGPTVGNEPGQSGQSDGDKSNNDPSSSQSNGGQISDQSGNSQSSQGGGQSSDQESNGQSNSGQSSSNAQSNTGQSSSNAQPNTGRQSNGGQVSSWALKEAMLIDLEAALQSCQLQLANVVESISILALNTTRLEAAEALALVNNLQQLDYSTDSTSVSTLVSAEESLNSLNIALSTMTNLPLNLQQLTAAQASILTLEQQEYQRLTDMANKSSRP